ncbi:MAG: hypothetical protein ACJ8AW_55115 [Rhodopila sp.]
MTVLIVNDDVGVLTALVSSFKRLGNVALQAVSAETAFLLSRSDLAIKILITEMILPDLDWADPATRGAAGA